MDYIQLNATYAISGQLDFFIGKGGLPTALISNSYAKAEISLDGAQLLSFIPTGQKDLLWSLLTYIT